MCRWLAYSGAPLLLQELLYNTEVSLIEQSRSARHSRTPTNADGFGIGWYGNQPEPGTYRHVRPAWNDENLRDLAAHIEAPMFLAHVRAATHGLVQQANCHPFRHGRWLFVHNGEIAEFPRLRRALMMEIAPRLFPEIRGTTDSEVFFYLALTYGLEHDPFGALERTVGFIERTAAEHGIERAVQMSLGLADGERLLAVRYSTEGHSCSLYHSMSIEALTELSHGDARLKRFSDDARAIVSEPLTELPDIWVEIPEANAVVISRGEVSYFPFQPVAS